MAEKYRQKSLILRRRMKNTEKEAAFRVMKALINEQLTFMTDSRQHIRHYIMNT